MERRNFWSLIRERQIVFPLIQRDYAQGRTDPQSSLVRKSFIASLLSAVCDHADEKPLLLGFIFGGGEGGRFVPFDGQQRLTTLYLLHLYAAVRARPLQNADWRLFYKFRYEAREETNAFIESLLDAIGGSSGEEIRDLFSSSRDGPLIGGYVKKQPWFSPFWRRDQSISGFLVTLDEIRRSFAAVENLWEILISGEKAPIQFYFADIAEFNASADDLFIKMNARGKGLGRLEKFKAAFIEWLKLEAPEREESIAEKMDMAWSDLFWSAFGKNYEGDKARETDNAFYNFLNWLADILACLSGAEERSGRSELFDKITSALRKEPSALNPGSLSLMESALDSLAMLEKERGVENYLDSIFISANDETMPSKGKISWFREAKMFREICGKGKLDPEGSLMFFALLLLLVNNYKRIQLDGGGEPSRIAPEGEQILRLRLLRNLLENSQAEIAGAKMADLLEGAARIINTRIINKDQVPHIFNRFQLAEELAKMKVRGDSPGLAENMAWLEDHPLLRGSLAVFSVKNSYRGKPRFAARELEAGRRLFEKTLGAKPLPWDQLLRGFLCENIFGLREGSESNKYFYLGKNGGRRKIFTASRADCFAEIRDAVQKLAEKIAPDQDCSMETALDKIIYKWVEKCRRDQKMDWRWYFVAYPEILPSYCQTDGYYDWDYNWRSFEQRQLQKQLLKGPHRNPFLWAVYVESGLEDPDRNQGRASFQDASGKGRDNPIAFHRAGLGLWGGEFYWRIHTANGRPPGAKQLALMKELRGRLAEKGVEADPNGYCFIPGKDSSQWSRKNFSPEQTAGIIRKYDKKDRVELGKQIAAEMLGLR